MLWKRREERRMPIATLAPTLFGTIQVAIPKKFTKARRCLRTVHGVLFESNVPHVLEDITALLTQHIRRPEPASISLVICPRPLAHPVRADGELCAAARRDLLGHLLAWEELRKGVVVNARDAEEAVVVVHIWTHEGGASGDHVQRRLV